MKNYNHEHKHSGGVISGAEMVSITVGQLRDALVEFTDDAEIIFGETGQGILMFYRFETRGTKTLQMEFYIDDAEPKATGEC